MAFRVARALLFLGVARITAQEAAAPTSPAAALPLGKRGLQDAASDDAWLLSRGEPCKGSEVMWGACPDLPLCSDGEICAPIDCLMEAWSDWSSDSCTGLCERKRSMERLNNHCGEPCTGTLVETKNDTACFTCIHPKKVDCEWALWTSWSACSRTCGGGQMTRQRDVLVSPKEGGELCKDLTREEIAPCHQGACERSCLDGEWGDWEEWSACSHSCGGGTRLRSRLINVEANECGRPAIGNSQEFEACRTHESCEEDADCVFAQWTDWSACSCDCDGVMRRSRRIEAYGRGNGQYCVGSTKDIMACNPGPADLAMPTGCEVAEPVDCEMSAWEDWAACTATCGAGQRDRRRAVTREARASGRPCAGPLMETVGCGVPCIVAPSVDCLWGQWSTWGACDKCGGEKRRYRQIENMPQFGGRACADQTSEEFAACPRSCHGRSYCSFMEWTEWDSCSASCGSGTRTRRRELELTTEKPLQLEYEELQVRTEQIEADRMQEIFTAFAAGSTSFALVLASVRVVRMSRRRMFEDRVYTHVDTASGLVSESAEPE